MNLSVCLKEIQAIFKHWAIWSMLANQDIKLRYRRSTIGPFWITISMAVTIYSMGFLYSHLFRAHLATYFPFLATGVIGWAFISILLTEASNTFIESEAYIKNQESFFSLFIMRVTLRNFLIFLHNLVVFLPIAFYYQIGIGWATLALIPGLLILFINALCWGSLLAIIGARYRDFNQIITSLIQVAFFLTPIMWMPTLLPENLQWVVDYNPFNQFLNLIRLPLLNQSFTLQGLALVGGMTLLGFMLYAYFIGRHKSRIVFWL